MNPQPMRPAFRLVAALFGILLVVLSVLMFFSGAPFWTLVFPTLQAYYFSTLHGAANEHEHTVWP